MQEQILKKKASKKEKAMRLRSRGRSRSHVWEPKVMDVAHRRKNLEELEEANCKRLAKQEPAKLATEAEEESDSYTDTDMEER